MQDRFVYDQSLVSCTSARAYQVGYGTRTSRFRHAVRPGSEHSLPDLQPLIGGGIGDGSPNPGRPGVNGPRLDSSPPPALPSRGGLPSMSRVRA